MKRILVVDDSLSMRAQMRSILEREGFEVIEAADGVQALSLLATSKGVDLVLTDLNMPRLDGIGLLRRIRRDPNHGMLPVIIQSSEAQGQVMAAGRQAGATGWLVKPYSEEKLLLTLRRLLPG